MKRTILLMAMALTVSVAFGQTAEKLIKKYKRVSGMQYQNLTKNLKKIKKEDDPENYRILRDISLAEVVSGAFPKRKIGQLQKDLDALQDFRRIYYEKHNSNDDWLSMFKGTFKLFNNVQFYAVEDEEYFNDLIVRIDADTNDGNILTLIHLKGKIKPEDVPTIIQIKENDGVDMRKEMKENVLIVIEGKEYPDLHSAEEAAEYMKANNISWNTQKRLIGKDLVKEKYPNSNKNVAIEFSDYTKEAMEYVEKGDVLFVINGKEYPEFRSFEAVEEFMESNGIKCFNKHWVSKEEAKKKYPNTDRKAIIEYY